MATSVSQVITDIRNELVSTVGGFWSDTELVRLYNRACKDYARETHCLKVWAPVSTVADTNQVTLPVNCMSVTKVIIKIVDQTSGKETWRELEPVSLSEMTDRWPTMLSTSSDFKQLPVAYTVVDDQLFLNCPVDEGSDNLYIFYDARAGDVTNTALPTQIPEELLEHINQFMIWKCMKKEREFNDAADAERHYVAGCGKGRGWVKRQLLAGQWKIRLPLNTGDYYTFNPF